jgi:hypothetical protein
LESGIGTAMRRLFRLRDCNQHVKHLWLNVSESCRSSHGLPSCLDWLRP